MKQITQKMSSQFGASMRPRSAMKRKNMMRNTPQSKTSFMGRQGVSPNRNIQNAEEFKRQDRIGQDFETRAEDFFTSK